MKPLNLFFSDTATKDQDLTESVVEELHHDITSPVRSFLEKSKQQVEKYWKSMLNDVDEDEAEAAEEKQRHLGTIHILRKHLYTGGPPLVRSPLVRFPLVRILLP